MRDIDARVHNLEVALHAMWAALKDLQPPATQDDIQRMMAEHFDLSGMAADTPRLISAKGADHGQR